MYEGGEDFMKNKLQDVFTQYGRMGIIVYFGIFFLSFFVFWTILSFGIDIRSWSWFSGILGDLGSIGLAYAATKLVQPIRIGLTILITPLVVRVVPLQQEIPSPQEKEEEADV